MEFGIQARGDWEYVLTAARWAEERGDIVAVGLPDHYLQRGDDPEKPAWDHLVHLAALARETTRVELVSMVSPVTFRHPAVYFKMGVTLDEISGGRFTLGLGAGWLQEEFTVFGLPYPTLGTRMEMYEEAMAYLRAAITPGANGFRGKHFTLEEFDPHPRPRNLRIMGGGAGGPKARRIAALYADEYNLYARKPDDYSQIRDATRRLAAEAGRQPDEITWSSAGPGVAARREADYRRLLEGMAGLSGHTPDYIESRWEERGYPHGSGSKPAEMIAALEEAGCTRFYPQVFVTEDDPRDFDLAFDAYMGR
ncbi:MAG TPA: LLM class flavin-dependent oxidoreductase [Acidimicrobiia bacterium]|jgi:alkanesulfonate monooxygenase SsuD/methylene tetrahydromethanopterin reductase-like flavin-dependent oxidoreductase (luciferase family)|nr:LLM class flavin-dependent oxidoreductase [Acidimicrobiia bacterium]